MSGHGRWTWPGLRVFEYVSGRCVNTSTSWSAVQVSAGSWHTRCDHRICALLASVVSYRSPNVVSLNSPFPLIPNIREALYVSNHENDPRFRGQKMSLFRTMNVIEWIGNCPPKVVPFSIPKHIPDPHTNNETPCWNEQSWLAKYRCVNNDLRPGTQCRRNDQSKHCKPQTKAIHFCDPASYVCY